MKHLELKVLGYHTRSRGVADKRWPCMGKPQYPRKNCRNIFLMIFRPGKTE